MINFIKSGTSKQKWLIFTLVIILLIGQVLQVIKNTSCIPKSLSQNTPVRWLIIFVILFGSITIIISRVRSSKPTKKTNIPRLKKIFRALEWILAILAVLCTCFQDEKGNLIDFSDINLDKLITCVFVMIGVFGSIILSDFLIELIHAENQQASITEF